MSVIDSFGFSPLVLWGVIEVPVKVYIMLLDSRVSHTLPDAYPLQCTHARSLKICTHCCCALLHSYIGLSVLTMTCPQYWSALSLTADNSARALDQLSDELVGEVAEEMLQQRREMGAQKHVPCHHWSR